MAMNIQEIKTESGITAWLVEDHSAPVISLRFSFEAGSRYDPQGKEGAAILTSMLLGDGAGDMDDATFDKAVSNLSANIEFGANCDHLVGHMMTLTKNKSKTADLLNLALTKPRFDQGPFAKAVESEVQSLQADEKDKYDMAFKKEASLLYPNHPYARFATISSVKSITVEDVKDFHAKMISQNGLLIAISGDVTAKEAAKLIDQIFGDIPKQPREPYKREMILFAGTGDIVPIDFDIPQSYFSVVQKGVGPHDQNWFAQLIVSQIMGGGIASVLNDEIRAKRGLSYGFKSYIISKDELQAFEMGGETKNESAGEVMSLLIQACREAVENGFTQDQIDKAKTYLKGHMPLQLDSNKKISEFLLGALQEGVSIERIQQYNMNIESVSADLINQYAKKLLNPDTMLFIVVGKPEGLKKSSAEYPYVAPEAKK